MASSVASISSSSVPFGSVLHNQTENNILKLKLKKPKSWNWELSTSKSSANIDFPRILLYDSNNKLLADVDEANFIVNGKENDPATLVHRSPSDISRRSRLRKSCSFSVSNSSLNSGSTIILSDRSNDKYSSLKSDITFKSTRSLSISQSTLQHDESDVSIKNEIKVPTKEKEEKLPEVPIYIYSAKGLVKRDFNAKEFDEIRNRQNSLDSGKSSGPLIPQENKAPESQDNLCTIDEARKRDANLQLTTELNTNALEKCKSMAEILANGKTRKKSRQKLRRTKSVNSSSSSKCQNRNITQNPSPPSSSLSMSSHSCEEDIVKKSSRKPVYYAHKSAAGTILVPEDNMTHRRVRRRHRSKSSDKLDRVDFANSRIKENARIVGTLKPFTVSDITEKFPSRGKSITKTDNSISNVHIFSSHELNSVEKNLNECINDITEINNDINEITAIVDCENGGTYESYNQHLVSIKTENNQPNVKNGRTSSVNSSNNVNNGTDRKQKKAQLNRKVSFVQFNCEKNDRDCNGNGCNDDNDTNLIHNDWIDVQLCDDSHQNGKCINTRTNGRKKVCNGKIKKSASVASFCNNYSTSDSDDYDTYATPPVRHKMRRFSQRPKPNSSSYQHHGE